MSLVSVPSSGDYQFLRYGGRGCAAPCPVSVPSSGDYQFLPRPGAAGAPDPAVSVPSSGDYQFLHINGMADLLRTTRFPSPHPGIINFFTG